MMGGRVQRREIRCPIPGAEVGLCWVGVGVPPAREEEGEGQQEVVVETPLEVVMEETPLEAVKFPGVALGLGLGEVAGWKSPVHSVQASGRPQSCIAGGCH